MADARPTSSCRSDIRSAKQKQFSRPMTGHTPQKLPFFRRNLLHHRSARAECPYTRPIIIPSEELFVKHYFRKNHKFFLVFSVKMQNILLPVKWFIANQSPVLSHRGLIVNYIFYWASRRPFSIFRKVSRSSSPLPGA